MSDIKENIKNIKNNIKKIEENLKLEKNSVKLLAVSKTQSIDNIKEAYNSGQQDFGENYLQESIEKISKLKDFDVPSYQTDEAAGVDLSASIENSIKIRPWEREIIPCGISIAMPKGLEAQIRPRSGLAFKHGITILNTPGTIDSDYRGEIKVILINLSKDEFTVHPKDRIAQMVFTNAIQVKFKEVQNLDQTKRGDGGFGSTGKD